MLSKSKYIKGLQCEKRLWLDKHKPELKDALSSAQEALFSQGTSVGDLAQQLFPGGKDASKGVDLKANFGQWIKNTSAFINRGETIIYEAAFNPNRAFAAMDILIKEEKGWRAIEVKSSTSAKDYTIDDAAVQYYILTQAGIDLVDIEIMYINNEYVKQGNLDLKKLFTRESVLDRILPMQKEIPNKMKQFMDVLKSKLEPDIGIGPHCENPFSCDFIGHCWKHIPEESIFSIGSMRGKEWELHDEGIYHINDIPADFPLNDKQRLHLNTRKSGEEVFERESVQDFLSDWTYPLYFFDFETIGPAVPLFDHSRPYQHFPFQYSLHVLDSPDSKLKHREFLPEPKGDPREELVKQMISDLGKSGSIVTWNMGFEKGKISDLANSYPEYSKELLALNERVVDLMIPFQQRWIYKAEMKNSASIKNVLPAYIPDLSYANLNIQNGGDASEIYKSMLEGRFTGDMEESMQDLKSYCELDTLAMVKIYKKLIQELSD